MGLHSLYSSYKVYIRYMYCVHIRAGTVQDFHGSVQFRFSYPRFDFFRIGSVNVFNTMK